MNIRFNCKTGDKVNVRRLKIISNTEHTELATVIKSSNMAFTVKAFGDVIKFWRDGKIYGEAPTHMETFNLI